MAFGPDDLSAPRPLAVVECNDALRLGELLRDLDGGWGCWNEEMPALMATDVWMHRKKGEL